MNRSYFSFTIIFILLCFGNIIMAGYGEDNLENNIESPYPIQPLVLTWTKDDVQELYESLNDKELNLDMLQKGILGLQKLIRTHPTTKSRLLTLIDFEKPSSSNRLYLIDLYKKKILIKTHVAHGRASGDLYASDFSNAIGSNKSSLGFYLTAETYQGKHGYSMRLDGIEESINDNARERAIVLHSADYVSDDFVFHNGRLGRSLGCPAVSADIFEELISLTKNQTCLFIYYPEKDYFSQSDYINYDSTHVMDAMAAFYLQR